MKQSYSGLSLGSSGSKYDFIFNLYVLAQKTLVRRIIFLIRIDYAHLEESNFDFGDQTGIWLNNLIWLLEPATQNPFIPILRPIFQIRPILLVCWKNQIWILGQKPDTD